MPIYEYQCNKCLVKTEEFSKITEFKSKNGSQCECGGELESILSGGAHGYVHQDPTTIGQFAEQQAKKEGKYKNEDKRIKHQERESVVREKMWRERGWTEKNIPSKEELKKINQLNKLTDSQKERYIATGKLP